MAGFIGTVNRVGARPVHDGWEVLGRSVRGTVAQSTEAAAHAAVRPEQLALDRTIEGKARVLDVSILGPITRVRVQDEVEGEVIADLLSSDSADLTVDAPVRLRLRDDVTDVVILERPDRPRCRRSCSGSSTSSSRSARRPTCGGRRVS